MDQHPEHRDIIQRLKRADGHLRSIIEMLESGRGCLDIAQQMQAVEKAIVQAKKSLVHQHIDHCLDHALRSGARPADELMQEFKAISKYL